MSDTVWLRSDTRTVQREKRWRPTLKQLFIATVVALVLALGALFLLLLSGSQDAIRKNAATLREQAARDLAERIHDHLAKAEDAQRDIETQLKTGVLSNSDVTGVEAALFTRLAHHPMLSELALTYAPTEGRDEAGALRFKTDGRWQISVCRATPGADGTDIFTTRHVFQEHGKFVVATSTHDARTFKAPTTRTLETPTDPLDTYTFSTPVQPDFYGKPLWSDLHWVELDANLPEAQRRVAVSVQKALNDGAGQFAGVLRVGLIAGQLDALAKVQLAPVGEKDPHRVFLCDREGRLISRLSPEDVFEVVGDDVRVHSNAVPPELRKALTLPELTQMEGTAAARFESGGEDYLATFQALEGSQDWVVGIVVPESAYLKDLVAARNRLLASSLAVMALILVGGAWTLGVVRRDLSVALLQTERIGNFDFGPSQLHARIADLDTILDGMERSKTSMRSICKYVPTELVRLLYEARAEPILGSELRELTLMFTDLKDFTTVSEQLPPNQLARALGAYLETMTTAVHSTHGTVDKYIGDAVMAFWNAPTLDAEHARKACEAALRCVEATEKLFQSPQWAGLPALVTRFGLHRAKVMVGHFGAPDRLNYTAIGDGVNAAARLEGLNKEYGTSILASEAVYDATKDLFLFRLLDEVAVKGKSQSLKVYELLGRAGGTAKRSAAIEAYEAAFALYRKGEFERALEILRGNAGDAPSVVLAGRCEHYLIEKPVGAWDGVYKATHK